MRSRETVGKGSHGLAEHSCYRDFYCVVDGAASEAFFGAQGLTKVLLYAKLNSQKGKS